MELHDFNRVFYASGITWFSMLSQVINLKQCPKFHKLHEWAIILKYQKN